MITDLEYALMAGGAYISTRGPQNQFPDPPNWVQENAKVGTNGFEAVSYFNGGTNQIVISFAGTFPSDISGDQLANLGLGAGTGSTQLRQAAQYYLDSGRN